MDNAISGIVWYNSLRSSFLFVWSEVKHAFSRGTITSIPKAILKLSCVLCCACRGALKRRKIQATFKHSGIVYFYILMCSTVVLDLWQVITKPNNQSTPYRLRHSYETTCMFVSIVALIYISCKDRGSRRVFNIKNISFTLYLRAGLYIFGVFAMGYSLCLLLNYATCEDNCCINTWTRVINSIEQGIKALFIITQILCLGSIYQENRLSIDTPLIQIILAHLLGTNLSLWFETLCLGVHNPGEEICKSFPTPLGQNIEKISYPLFVEYYLLAASMLYEAWTKLEHTETNIADINRQLLELVNRRHDERQNYGTVNNQGQGRGTVPQVQDDRAHQQSVRERRRNIPQSYYGRSLICGLIIGAFFLVFVIASQHVGKNNPTFYEIFVWVTCVGYGVQMFACFVLQLCIQSQQDSGRTSVDYDDALLYIALAGIILWDGFHFYGLATLTSLNLHETLVDMIMGPIQYITQTVTLVTIRRYHSSNDKNSKWICYCALFLLATNIAIWCHNTFFIEGSDLEKPGENNAQLQTKWEVFARILNPLIIFFRFHSATCCYHVMVIFKEGHEQQIQNEEQPLIT